jgi:hypothetical protein
MRDTRAVNVNVSIVDQHVRGLADRLKGQIEFRLGQALDPIKARSVAFVLLCVKTMLDMTDDDALDTLTEGGRDFGVDALDVSPVVDGEFTVTMFQGKYKHENLEGVHAIPEDAVIKAVQAVRTLFDPSAGVSVNARLLARIEEVRSLILDGNIPRVRFLLCNNGPTWKRPEAQDIIDREHFPDRVRFEHVNHDRIIEVLQATEPVKETLQFAGRAIVEDLNYARVFVGKVPVSEFARLMGRYGDRLLDRNIRRYLGAANPVNKEIADTLRSPDKRSNFYFYNNGVTLVCDRFDYNALQTEHHKVQVEGLQIINGAQTSRTIQAALADLPDAAIGFDQVYVLVRLYQMRASDPLFVQTITCAVNSQSPVDLRDLRSNDEQQKALELSMTPLGFHYRRQRSNESIKPDEVTTGTAAIAVLAVWRRRPQQTRFHTNDHFSKLYGEIFTPDLNAAQVVTAVLLYRIAENKRRRPPVGAPDLVSYASCFAAMLMGEYLLADLKITLDKLDHRCFAEARQLVDSKGDAYFDRAVSTLDAAVKKLYGGTAVSLQQLSATFRRGDLFRHLTPV